MAGQMHLAVLADNLAIAVDQDRGVVVVAVRGQLRVAQIEADIVLRGLVEQRARGGVRHLALEPRIDLSLIGHVPAREEGGERKFGEHHEVDALRVRLIEQVAQPLYDGLAGLGFLDGTGLGSSNADNAGHQEAILRSSRLISRTTGHNITR